MQQSGLSRFFHGSSSTFFSRSFEMTMNGITVTLIFHRFSFLWQNLNIYPVIHFPSISLSGVLVQRSHRQILFFLSPFWLALCNSFLSQNLRELYVSHFSDSNFWLVLLSFPFHYFLLQFTWVFIKHQGTRTIITYKRHVQPKFTSPFHSKKYGSP